MARHLFGLSPADVTVSQSGTSLVLEPGSTGTAWDSLTGGTQITDLTDLAGTPIASVTSDTYSILGFYGPDGVTTLYLDFGFTGGRVLMQASDLGASITDLQANKADIAADLRSGGSITGDLDVSGRLTSAGFALPLPYRGRHPKYRDRSLLITNFQTGHGWTTSGAVGSSNLNDTSTFVKGTQSVSVTTNGTGGGGANLQQLSLPTLDLTGKAIRFQVKVDDTSTLSQLNLLIGTDSAFNNSYKWQTLATTATSKLYKNGEWTTVTLGWADLHSAAGTFSLDSHRTPSATSGFTKMRFQIIDTGSPVTVHVQSVEVLDNISTTFPNGVVSVVFDDSWDGQWNYARPKMDQYGFRGTNYTIADRIGQSGRLTMTQLRSLQDLSGWEVAGHAYTTAAHDNRLTTLTKRQVDDELRNLRSWLITNGFDGDSFAYPGGNFENTTDGFPIEDLVGRYFSSGRTVLTGYGSSANVLSEQFPPPRPYRMLALSGISDASGGQGLPSGLVADGGELDVCQRQGSWLILTFHVITTGTTGGDDGVITQTDFNTVMDAIAAKGIPVLPVGDVMRYYS
ncbi:polysaccharide deacetylase family protein [Streptomyces sp. NBC_00343]|uniref:polysaccharide deacetylase family protein n=1 Tax=Streptomyces sp. NBC_00343 TaxID=2975719 RepID=UPI002E28707D|nr:polysaccharide deacetylase family protein [Streptomyces sp. NBC_00343]